MSGSGHNNAGPSELQKSIANFVAGTIIGVGRIVYSIFRLVFQILRSIA